MNKRRLSQASLLRLPICFFPGREKAKWFRLRICFFRGREIAKWFRLRICFFPTREKAKWFRLPICFFPDGQTSNLLFPGPGKSKMVQTSNFQFAFSRPGKKQNGSDFHFAFSRMYQTCSLESKQRLWDSSPQPSAYEFGPYPLGHSSLKNLFFPGFTKENWMSNLLFRLKLPICFFPGSYDHVVCALTAVGPTTSPHIPALVGML